jgi:hypothetical protein
MLGDLIDLTWLEGTSNLVGSTSDILGEDLSGGLLRLRGDLLTDLFAETFAPAVCKWPRPGSLVDASSGFGRTELRRKILNLHGVRHVDCFDLRF